MGESGLAKEQLTTIIIYITICYIMRTVVNISLPSQLSLVVDRVVSSGKFSSKSEFFRLLLRDWIEEHEIVEDLKRSRKELQSGKGKLLKSLKDLR